MELQAYLAAAALENPLPPNAFEIFAAPGARDLSEPLSTVRPALRLADPDVLVDLALLRHRWLAADERVQELDADVSVVKRFAGAAPRVEQVQAAHELGQDTPDRAAAYWAWFEASKTATLADGAVTVSTVSGHSRAAALQPLAGHHKLAELTAETWFSIQRDSREGALMLQWEHPVDAALASLDAHRPLIDTELGRRKPMTLFKERFPYFDRSICERLSADFEDELVRAMAIEYRSLLEASPVKVTPLGAVFVGTDKQRVGLALLDKRGAVGGSSPLRPAGDWQDRVLRWLKEQRARLIVLPQSAPAGEWLTSLEDFLTEQKVRVVKVSPAGMVEARSIDDPILRRVSPEEASAIVLLRRAAKPIDEWCRIEPGRLGLSRVQGELTPRRVSEVLQVVRERVIASAQPMSAAPVVTGGLRARSTAPLNPDITNIRDLRPGLQVKGIITNVTKFGAFVNLGLKQEGLVHISELADDYVAEPSEVVQAGQQVSARVITVDADRGRIALSLRSEAALARGPSRPPGRSPMSGPPRRTMGSGMPATVMSRTSTNVTQRPEDIGGASDGDRTKALRDLENLFKK